MSSIEVLRKMQKSAKNPNNTCWLFSSNRDKALGDALLWKIKLDKLEKWLEKQDLRLKKIQSNSAKNGNVKSQINCNAKIQFIKEVVGVLRKSNDFLESPRSNSEMIKE